MRSIVLVLAFTSVALAAGQRPEEGRTPPPGKEDTVTVRGCVTGGLLRDVRARKTDDKGKVETAAVYRLTGDKKLVQQMEREHADEILDVTGAVRRTPNSSSTTRSKQAGKTRIYVGVGQQPADELRQPAAYPELRVASFAAAGGRCGS